VTQARLPSLSHDSFLAAAVWGALALSIGNVVAQTVDFGVFDLRYQALNSNTHASIFGAVSLVACGLAVAVSFAVARKHDRPAALLLPFALAVVLALRVWRPPHVLFLALPFTTISLVMLWREGAGRDQTFIRAGCSLLILSYVFHGLDSAATLDPKSWWYQIWSLAKHDAELAGWILVAGGLISIARRSSRHPSTEPLPVSLRPASDAQDRQTTPTPLP
jgi:hypothetical protein